MEDDIDQGGEWQLVNNQQKKAQQKQKSKENRKKDKTDREKEKDKEDKEREEKRQAFLQQYVYKQTPDTTSSSMFDAFRDGSSKKALLKHNDMVSAQDFDPTEKEIEERATKHAAKKPKAPKKPAVTEVAKKLDASQLKETLNQYAERFPTNHELQVKGLAEQLETIFNNADTKKLVAAENEKPYLQSLDFPYTLLPKDVHDTIKAFLDKIPEAALISFYSFLITTYIAIAIEKNFALVTSGLGVKYLIQFVTRNYPQVLVKSIPAIKQSYTDSKVDVANANVSILKKSYAPFFLWVFGQSSSSLAAGLTVWFHFMLPIIFTSGVAESVRESSLVFIENLVQTKSKTMMDDINAVMGFERLMLYSVDKSFSARLKAVATKILSRSFLFGEKHVSKRFFTMLLGHAATSKQSLREIVFSNMVECFEKDASIYTFWNEIYVNNIAQSNNVMLYITLNWETDNLHKRLKADTILQTAKSFTAANKQLLAGTYLPPGDKKNKPKKVTDSSEVKEINMMTATCKALREKLQGYATVTKDNSSSSSKNGGGGLILSILPVGVLVAGAAYTAMNCCTLDWCSSNPTLSDLFKC